MPASIGVNLRVTGHCRQGGRKYMEDFFSVAYQQTEDEKDLEYAFFGIYDGHGGAEAAAFAKEHLMESIVKHRGFWSDDDDEVLRSIKDGFLHTHHAMWKIHDKWPKTTSGLPSTAGTTASIAFIRRGKIYIGHVGDSGITLGFQDAENSDWRAKALTKDHKPESHVEMMRIEQSGGKVVSKSGVPRVVWNRPRIGHKGPVRRSTPIDEIPFLAVARSLGDLWSYNAALDDFVVSPTPDVTVIPIDTATFRCLIFGTDGLYNMLSPHMAVHIVQQAEKHNEQAALSDVPNKIWINPSKCLVEKALERWANTKMRADNTSVITLMLDPPGPPRAQVLRSKKNTYSSSGLQIETRYQEKEEAAKKAAAVVEAAEEEDTDTDISKIKTAEEVDAKFVPRPRESTAFDTRPPEQPPQTGWSVECTNDIQINEVSSSDDGGDDENRLKPATTTRRSSTHKKSNVEPRKINLRSSAGRAGSSEEISSTRTYKKGYEENKRRSPLGENMAETSRVLRERRNTLPTLKKKFAIKRKLTLGVEKKKLLQSVLFRSKEPSSKSPTGRKTWSASQPSQDGATSSAAMTSSSSSSAAMTSSSSSSAMTSRTENTDKSPKPQPKQSRHSDRLSLKSPSNSSALVTTKKKELVVPVPTPVAPPKGKSKHHQVEPRVVRKSTLAQKLRIHQATFKAKLRGGSSKILTRDKAAARLKKKTGRS